MARVIRRSKKYILGHPMQSLLISVFMFLVFISTLLLGYFLYAEQSYMEVLFQRYPASALLLPRENSETYRIEDVFRVIETNSHVVGFNITGSIKGTCELSTIDIIGNQSTEYDSHFLFDELYLSAGTYPDTTSPGVILPNQFAEMHKMHLGDEIKISSKTGYSITVEVVGLYEGTLENITFFVNLNVFQMLGGKPSWDSPTIFLNNPYNADSIIQEINDELPEECGYHFFNSSEYNMSQMYKSIRFGSNFLHIVAIFYFAIMMLAYFFLQWYNAYRFRADCKILFLLGEQPEKIFIQHLFQNLFIAFPIMIFSAFLSLFAFKPLNYYWISMATQSYTEGSSTESFFRQAAYLSTVEPPHSYLFVGLFCLLQTVIIIVLSVLSIKVLISKT